MRKLHSGKKLTMKEIPLFLFARKRLKSQSFFHIFFCVTLVLLSYFPCHATTLLNVRFGYYPNTIRVVLDFDEPFSYTTEEAQDKIIIRLNKVNASPSIQNYEEINDLVVRYLEVEKEGTDLKVSIPLSETVNYSISSLSLPSRLVIDFDRDFLNLVSGGMVFDGVEYLKLKEGASKGNLIATVLKIDPNKARLEPALAKKYKPSFFESFINFFNVFKKPEPENNQHFYLEKLKNIAESNNALAAVNGTFFANNGAPLGALIINQELVALPIYDRTALIIDGQNRAMIDNIFAMGKIKLEDGTTLEITGINQARDGKDLVIYSPVWGDKTGTTSSGIELVVIGGEIKEINPSNSSIPDDGYVISASGNFADKITKAAKIDGIVDTQFKIIPYSCSPKGLLHLIAGGPRLLKGGRIYISKHEEKFRDDVAERRAARTAVGISKTGEIIFITVAAPQKNKANPSLSSLGATLEELANLLQSLGAIEALNFDGGGSTGMVADNKVVCGGGRRISNAILIYPKP